MPYRLAIPHHETEVLYHEKLKLSTEKQKKDNFFFCCKKRHLCYNGYKSTCQTAVLFFFCILRNFSITPLLIFVETTEKIFKIVKKNKIL